MSDDRIDIQVEDSAKSIQYYREDAIRDLWQMGNLRWKLDDTQKEIYNAVQSSDAQKFVINASRRLGKSFLLCLIAIEYAIKHPGSRICYAAPTAKAVKKIITPIFNIIMQDCPRELKPKWKAQDQIWEFNNTSEIHIAGTDAERAEALRGQSMDLGVVDEAGFMSQLDYVVSDILMPQTLTTDGRIIIASTPPKSPAHDFKIYAEEAELRGNYIKRTIYDNPRISKKKIIKFMMETDATLTEEQAELHYDERGGPNNSTWKREYMAQFMTDQELAVVPEFDEDAQKDIVTDLYNKPMFYDAYVSMDIGFSDFTVVLFGYWDFLKAKLIIEDEIVMNRETHKVDMTTFTLAEEIKQKELQLWGGKKPYLRYSDTDLIVISDLQRLHGLTFIPTKKDNKEAAINLLRNLIKQRKIIINPRCKTLVKHLHNAIWNNQRTSFERSDPQGFGHFDAVDAIIYMVRNVQFNKNPIPNDYGLNIYDQYVPSSKQTNEAQKQLSKLMPLKRFFPDWNKD